MRRIILGLLMLPMMALGQTLEECQQAAERNYPLIRQYDLIGKTIDLTIANIDKGWLPQLTGSAQTTYQSDVTRFPDAMQQMYRQLGIDMDGLKKDQYRVGIEVQQTVFDGGVMKSQKEIAREQGKVQAAENEVNLYKIRKRVNEMFFGLLLTDEQIQLNQDLQELLGVNEKKLASMFKSGTAAESDYLNVKAERLKVMQQATELQTQRQALARMLSVFCGIEVNKPQTPSGVESESRSLNAINQRPELKAIDARLKLADAREKALDAALKPKVGVFAQGFYGYPGYNMFEDMMGHKWSLNGMVGARLSWNIGSLYTRKNDKAKIQLQREEAELSREVFLFENNLEQIQQNENVERYKKLMADDDELITLRSNIRKAAESKLAHGIIDVNDLVKEINNENAARVQRSIHETGMLKEIYDLKYTVNN